MSKRLGSALTNVAGTANQVLRVNSAEDALEFYTPATIPSYTISNGSIDRAFDVEDTTIDELAAVVGTLVNDLQSIGLTGGSSLSTFTWSTSEQVYPFEKDVNGNTLYCKELDLCDLTSSTSYQIAHGVSNAVSKMFSYTPFVYGDNGSPYNQMTLGYTYSNTSVMFRITDTYVLISYTNNNFTGFHTKIRMIYAK